MLGPRRTNRRLLTCTPHVLPRRLPSPRPFFSRGGAAADDALGEACAVAYEDSAADSYCSDENIFWWSPQIPSDGAGCKYTAQCSVNVEIGEESATFEGLHGNLATILEMATLSPCFLEALASDPNSIGGWQMLVLTSAQCSGNGKIDLNTALSQGLPTREE